MAPSFVSEEQLAEERAVDEEQVEQARLWLTDADPAQRLTGAEQLSAYPTPAAEKYLLAALKDDADEEVRAAAANSLAAFKNPDNQLFEGLIAALLDIDENVRFNAWSSLEMQLNKPDLPAKTLKKMHSALAKLLKQRRVPSETRELIEGYLRDQQGA